MFIPKYWAECVLKKRTRNRQITIRRFGWSMESMEDAQRLANERATEAFTKKSNGDKKIAHKENKVAYNGAEGLPIREEILSIHNNDIITRNAYGAHCLNTPNTLFIDVDFNKSPKYAVYFVIALIITSAIFYYYYHTACSKNPFLPMAIILSIPISRFFSKNFSALQKVTESSVIRKIQSEVKAGNNLNFRVYKTPAGLRVLETSKTYDPSSEVVARLFKNLCADKKYAVMCTKQKCFRARLSAKPWRIGITHHMKPRPGVWPVSDEKLQIRKAWIHEYETVAQKYASCSFYKSFGSGFTSLAVQDTVRLHDEKSQAFTGKQIA